MGPQHPHQTKAAIHKGERNSGTVSASLKKKKKKVGQLDGTVQRWISHGSKTTYETVEKRVRGRVRMRLLKDIPLALIQLQAE